MKRILKIGLDSAAPFPLHSDYNSGVFEGFEVDLMKAIADIMDLELHYEVSLWQNILEKLYKGELDMICSAVTMTPSRKMILEFSKPYLQFQLCAVTNVGDSLSSISDFKAKRIGIRIATEAEKYVMAQFPGNLTHHAETNNELYQKLLAGKIDVLIDDSPIAGGFLNLNPKLQMSMFMPGTESQYAIAMKKGDLALKEEINHTIELLEANGTFNEIHHKWFASIRLV
jgi:ABC-type amino acid transport substrate-binding protein